MYSPCADACDAVAARRWTAEGVLRAAVVALLSVAAASIGFSPDRGKARGSLVGHRVRLVGTTHAYDAASGFAE